MASSCGSNPATAFNTIAASSTVRVSGPIVSSVRPERETTVPAHSPNVGLSPDRAAARRGVPIEPPGIATMAANTVPVATVTPGPPLKPPGMCSGSAGCGPVRSGDCWK